MVLKSLQSFTNYFFPSLTKIHVSPTETERSASNSDGANLARALCEGIPATSSTSHKATGKASAAISDKGRGRDGRAYVVAEEGDARHGESSDMPRVHWQADPETEDKGTLFVTGTIRGGRLSADRLVHIPGWGDYTLDRIAYAPLARQARAASRMKTDDAMTVDDSAAPTTPGQILSQPSEEADTLVAFNEADDMLMSNEQTGFTAEELARGDEYMDDDFGKKKVKRVPKGTSAYQAAWIIDDEEDDFEDDDEDEDEMEDLEEGNDFGGIGKGFGRAKHEEETEEVELDEREDDEDDYDDELDEDEEQRQ